MSRLYNTFKNLFKGGAQRTTGTEVISSVNIAKNLAKKKNIKDDMVTARDKQLADVRDEAKVEIKSRNPLSKFTKKAAEIVDRKAIAFLSTISAAFLVNLDNGFLDLISTLASSRTSANCLSLAVTMSSLIFFFFAKFFAMLTDEITSVPVVLCAPPLNKFLNVLYNLDIIFCLRF